MKNSCERVRKKNVKINIFKWIFFSTIWIQVLNMNQEENDMHVLFSYCTMYIHASSGVDGGCFGPFNKYMCNNEII